MLSEVPELTLKLPTLTITGPETAPDGTVKVMLELVALVTVARIAPPPCWLNEMSGVPLGKPPGIVTVSPKFADDGETLVIANMK